MKGAAAALALALTAGAAGAWQEPSEPGETGEEGQPLGSSTTWRLAGPAETLTVPAGTPLYARPSRRSQVLDRVTHPAALEVVEERAGWTRVRYQSWQGWVALARDVPDILDRGPTPEGRRVDESRLARLRERFPGQLSPGRLGPYPLYTDVGDRRLLDDLGAVAAKLDAAYRERFGISPGPPRAAAVALFAREADYRDYARGELLEEIRGETGFRLDSADCCGVLLSATWLGNTPVSELRRVLVHELTHLLNRRALGEDLPVWLDEGLAEDLGYGEIGEDGQLFPSRFGGRVDDLRRAPHLRDSRTLAGVRLSGPRASLLTLLAGWRGSARVPLEELFLLRAGNLTADSEAGLLHAESGFLVRYLLDGAGRQQRERFLGVLRSLASGAPRDSDVLLRALGSRPAELERGFYAWAVRLAEAHGVPVPR